MQADLIMMETADLCLSVMTMMMSLIRGSGNYEGQGYPLVQTGGLHYNNKWDDDKQSINGNYKILQLHVNGSSATNSQFILPDTLYFNNDKSKFS